jgi:membrane glycosyltransferase
MPPVRLSLTTPAGLQSIDVLTRRRWIVAALNVVTYAVLLLLAARILGTGGWTWVDIVLFVCFAFGTPWTVLGFWNALIGLWLLHFRKDAWAEVAPYAAAGDDKAPLRIKTAIFMTVRNEDPHAPSAPRTVKGSVATGEGGARLLVLSDTSDPVAAAEEGAVEPGRRRPDATVSSTPRSDSTAFKAAMCATSRWNATTLMLPLDADSLMSGAQIVRLTRMMQPIKIGICRPGRRHALGGAFARIFQFGMRHGMRSYTMGQACGSATTARSGATTLVRIKPFHERCDLPMPGSRRSAATCSTTTRSRPP